MRRYAAHEKCPPVSEIPADTLTYMISFSEKMRRDEFIESFRSFLDRYPLAELRDDSIAGQVLIRIAPAALPVTPGIPLTPVEAPSFSSAPIEPSTVNRPAVPKTADMMESQPSPPPTDTIIPLFGGKLRLHTPRAGIDGTLLPLVATDPFTPADSGAAPLLTVVNVSPSKATLQLNGRIIDGRGRHVSALDLIEAWTGYVKKHPAEGIALFRNVEGIADFVAGREAVIRGLGASDQKTCYLRLARPDPFSIDRIRTARLMGSIHAKLGAYYAATVNSDNLLLAPNLSSGKRKAYLDTLIITSAADNNPILSFSLKKYDAVILTSSIDVTYARTTLEKQAFLQVIAHDRYFIACAAEDENTRRYLASRINPAELLGSFVKAHGKPLAAIETDSGLPAADRLIDPPPPPVVSRFRILFRSDDMVSERIAEKLLADLSGSGIRATLAPAVVTEYERALVERNYECAVGWAPARILNDPSERLRLAAVWFDDETDESTRIAAFREIPLFSVERYLLMRKPAWLYRGVIEGICALSKRAEAPAE